MFAPFVQFVLGSHLLIAAANGLPAIDIQKTCRTSERELSAMFANGTTDYFESCMNTETAAREKLIEGWATFSTADRTGCVQPTVYMPSYVEWLTCLEITRDARSMRKAPPASAPKARFGKPSA